MADAPFFTVIIPTYNRENTIGETLDSVAGQTFRDFETIVVDDGSSDGTVEFIQKEFPWVQVVKQENAGPGVARNRGAEIARGEYLAFLDSDDLWFPWTLQNCHRALCDLNKPSYLTLQPFGFESQDEIKKVAESTLEYRLFDDYFATHQQWICHGSGASLIQRNVFLEAGGFPCGKINGEDADLAMRLGTATGFLHIVSPPMLAYRQHSQNVSHDLLKSQAGVDLMLSREKKGEYPGGSIRARERNEIISRHIRPFAIDCARKGQFKLAIRYYRALFQESIQHGRWKFLLGLPVMAFAGLLKSGLSGTGKGVSG
ncbi:MAG: glycosyltransferase family 2 protein [Planctomycetaceae bacterium]|nr:glycosyltransferase family 2 protein [Planctomycetaceae bacterium]